MEKQKKGEKEIWDHLCIFVQDTDVPGARRHQPEKDVLPDVGIIRLTGATNKKRIDHQEIAPLTVARLKEQIVEWKESNLEVTDKIYAALDGEAVLSGSILYVLITGAVGIPYIVSAVCLVFYPGIVNPSANCTSAWSSEKASRDLHSKSLREDSSAIEASSL